MNATVEHGSGHSDAQLRPAAVRGLLRWYSPYLAGVRVKLVLTIIGAIIVLICQAAIPWLVEVLLHHGEWSTPEVALLVVLAATMLIVSYITHLGAHDVANGSAVALRERIYQRLVHSRVLRQKGLLRSAVVVRMTADVDRVSEAFEETVVEGFPGIARLIISLVLLTMIEWRAGLAMAIAAIVFLVLRRVIGRRLVHADRARLHAQTELGQTVDESITNAATTSGLRLGAWQSARFTSDVHALEHATHRQGVLVSRLILAAHATAIIGLVFVVIAGMVTGGEDLAAVAASLLYLEGAARGLEALPPWIRSVNLAVVSERRLDEILQEPDHLTAVHAKHAHVPTGLVVHDVTVESIPGARLTSATAHFPRGVVGLVAGPGVEPDAVLSLLAGDENPDAGLVLLDGVDVRAPAAADQVAFVPSDASAYDASAMDLLRAADTTLDEQRAASILTSAGLSHFLAFPRGVNERLGPHGMTLMLDERQRLMLAVGMARRPTLLVLGSLLCLADVDTALPTIASVRDLGAELVVLTVTDPTVAEAVDAVAYVDDGTITIAPHRELLVASSAYADIWEKRLQPNEIDLSGIGIESEHHQLMQTRLVTERYAAGDLIYRQGAPADRVLFIFSGHVEVVVSTSDGDRRVAVLGPGSHCGDLRLTVGELRAESAFALDDCVIRSLSRDAITAGLTGLLDRTPTERRIVASLLREGAATKAELHARLGDVDAQQFDTALALLERDGAVKITDDRYAPVLRRSRRQGSDDLLDRLSDL